MDAVNNLEVVPEKTELTTVGSLITASIGAMGNEWEELGREENLVCILDLFLPKLIPFVFSLLKGRREILYD